MKQRSKTLAIDGNAEPLEGQKVSGRPDTFSSFHTYFVGSEEHGVSLWAHYSDECVGKSIRRNQEQVAKIEASRQAKPPQHENPGHHDPRNLPGKVAYNPKKDPLPSDAHDVYKTAIQHEGTWYGRSDFGEFYQYNYHYQPAEGGRKHGAIHFSGRTGEGYRGFGGNEKVSGPFSG